MSWSEAVVLVIGVALMAAAVIARRRFDRENAVALHEGLAAPDASARLQALDAVERDGLERHAATILDHLDRETDPVVLDRIRLIVARHSWEPLDSEAGTALRTWAARPEPGTDGSEGSRLVGLPRAIESAVEDEVTFLHVETPDEQMVIDRRPRPMLSPPERPEHP